MDGRRSGRRPRVAVPTDVFDVGLQQERTALAWDRTGLSMLVCSLLYLRAIGGPYGRPSVAPALIGIAAGAAMLFLGSRRYGRLHAMLRDGGAVDRHRYLLAVWVAAVLLGTSSLFAVAAA